MSRRKSAQHREMWTEDEVMEFGLAGEEEYCDMQVMEEIELSPPSFNSSMAPVDITKSGRVRKKTAKLIEMEEIDKLEKKQTVPARKPEVAKLSVGKKGKTVALKLSPDTIKLGSVTSIKEPDSELSSSDDLQPLVINTSFHKRSSSQSTKLAVKRKFDSSPDDVMSLPTKASRPTKKLKKKAQEVKVKVYESDLAVDYDGNSWSDGDMKGQFSLSVDESGLDQGDDFVENEGHKDLTPKIPVTKPKKPGRKKSMPLVSAVKQEQMSTPPSIQLASISAPAVPASYQYQGDNLLSEDKFENSYLNPLKKEKIRKKLKVEVKDSSFGESSNLSMPTCREQGPRDLCGIQHDSSKQWGHWTEDTLDRYSGLKRAGAELPFRCEHFPIANIQKRNPTSYKDDVMLLPKDSILDLSCQVVLRKDFVLDLSCQISEASRSMTSIDTQPETIPSLTLIDTQPETIPSLTLIDTQPETIPSSTLIDTQPETIPSSTLADTQPETIPSSTLIDKQPETIPSSTLIDTQPETILSSTLIDTQPETIPSSTLIDTQPETILSSTLIDTQPETIPSSTLIDTQPGTITSSTLIDKQPETITSLTMIDTQPGTIPSSTLIDAQSETIPSSTLIDTQPEIIPYLTLIDIQPETIPSSTLIDTQSETIPSSTLIDTQLETIPSLTLIDTKIENIPSTVLINNQLETILSTKSFKKQSESIPSTTWINTHIENIPFTTLLKSLIEKVPSRTLINSQSKTILPQTLINTHSETVPFEISIKMHSDVVPSTTLVNTVSETVPTTSINTVITSATTAMPNQSHTKLVQITTSTLADNLLSSETTKTHSSLMTTFTNCHATTASMGSAVKSFQDSSLTNTAPGMIPESNSHSDNNNVIVASDGGDNLVTWSVNPGVVRQEQIVLMDSFGYKYIFDRKDLNSGIYIWQNPQRKADYGANVSKKRKGLKLQENNPTQESLFGDPITTSKLADNLPSSMTSEALSSRAIVTTHHATTALKGSTVNKPTLTYTTPEVVHQSNQHSNIDDVMVISDDDDGDNLITATQAPGMIQQKQITMVDSKGYKYIFDRKYKNAGIYICQNAKRKADSDSNVALNPKILKQQVNEPNDKSLFGARITTSTLGDSLQSVATSKTLSSLTTLTNCHATTSTMGSAVKSFHNPSLTNTAPGTIPESNPHSNSDNVIVVSDDDIGDNLVTRKMVPFVIRGKQMALVDSVRYQNIFNMKNNNSGILIRQNDERKADYYANVTKNQENLKLQENKLTRESLFRAEIQKGDVFHNPVDELLANTQTTIPEKFLRENISVADKEHILFATDLQLRLLRNAKNWFVDVTREFVLKPFVQVFTIHAFVSAGAISCYQVPLAFVLMSGKREIDYVAVYLSIKKMIPNLKVETITGDFEIEMWTAATFAFGKFVVRGCFFYWQQAVLRKIREFGLGLSYFTNKNIYQFCWILMSLPFLPADCIPKIFEKLMNKYDKFGKLKNLIKFMERQWITNSNFPAKAWSVYQHAFRTNHDVNCLLDVQLEEIEDELNFHKLVEILYNTVTASNINTNCRLFEDEMDFRHRRKKCSYAQKCIEALWENADAGEILLEELLEQCSHMFAPEMQFKEKGAYYASCKKSLQIQLKKSLQATKKLLGQPKKKRQKGYTAYMLWCGVQRARVVAQNPGIDFAQISKRLGDMWQTVPEKEKMTWRRKARKMAKKGSSFINTGRPRIAPIETILIPEQQQQQQPMSKMVYHGKLPKNKEKSLVEDHSPVHSKVNNCLSVYNETVTGSDPMDVAAHLKLLGESLTVIGARLQEHKGQIAVQGSMSVLLDSLVCTLGSLLCLTSQVPELNGCPDEIHRRTLDNIAYIMPGVG